MKLASTLFALATVAILSSCNHTSKDVVTVYDTIDNELPALIQDTVAMSLKFSGKLPCADCPAIQTDLTLYPDSMHFELTQVYIDKNKEPLVTMGQYVTVNDSTKSDGTVFHLNPSSANDSWYFKAIGDSELVMLDKDLKELPNADAFYLKKQ